MGAKPNLRRARDPLLPPILSEQLDLAFELQSPKIIPYEV
jgi:hypothetical protein